MIRKEFILNELKYRYPDIAGSIRHPSLPVGRPIFWEGNGRNPGARIVICSAGEIKNAQANVLPEPLFLCIGKPEQRLLDAWDVCVLPDDEQPFAVMNFIQRLFDRLDEWTQRLKQIAETGESADELLATAGEMLQNPIWLLDERGHIVAQAESSETNENASPSLLLEGLRDDRLVPGGMRRIAGTDGTDRLHVRIESGGARYTLLCAATERTMYGSDEVVFESLAGYLRLMLSEHKLYVRASQRPCRNDELEQPLRSLLNADAPAQQVTETLSRLGWNESESYCVIAAEARNGALRAAQADAVCHLLETQLNDCCAFAYSPVIVAVMKSGIINDASLKEKLTKLAGETNCGFGVREAYTGFEHLPHRLEQAKLALNYATGEKACVLFSEVAEGYIVSQSAAEYPAELVCLRPVLALANHDQEHGTSYYETAVRYIKNRFNAVKTANDLFIHRSTLLYRLERIKTQFGLNLDDEQISLIHLLVSLRLVKDNIT